MKRAAAALLVAPAIALTGCGAHVHHVHYGHTTHHVVVHHQVVHHSTTHSHKPSLLKRVKAKLGKH